MLNLNAICQNTMANLLLALSLFVCASTAQQWILNGENKKEYYFGSDLVVYDDAVASCSKMNAALITINTPDIQEFLLRSLRQSSANNIGKNKLFQVLMF